MAVRSTSPIFSLDYPPPPYVEPPSADEVIQDLATIDIKRRELQPNVNILVRQFNANVEKLKPLLKVLLPTHIQKQMISKIQQEQQQLSLLYQKDREKLGQLDEIRQRLQ